MSSPVKPEASPPSLKKVEAEETKSIELHSRDESQKKTIQKVSSPQRSHEVDTHKKLLAEDSSDNREEDDSLSLRLGRSGSEAKKLLSTEEPVSRESLETHLIPTSTLSHATPDKSGLEMVQLSPKSQSCRQKYVVLDTDEGFKRLSNLRTKPEGFGKGSELKMDHPSPKSARSGPKERGNRIMDPVEGVWGKRSLRHAEPGGAEKEPEMCRLSTESRSCSTKERRSIINQNEVRRIRSLPCIEQDEAKEPEPEACRLSPKQQSCRQKLRGPIIDPVKRVGRIGSPQNIKGAEKESELEFDEPSPKPRSGRSDERQPKYNLEMPPIYNHEAQVNQIQYLSRVDNAFKYQRMIKIGRKLKKRLANEEMRNFPKNEKGKPNRPKQTSLLSHLLEASSYFDKEAEETESTSTEESLSSASDTESEM